jgi:hypothetical protein
MPRRSYDDRSLIPGKRSHLTNQFAHPNVPGQGNDEVAALELLVRLVARQCAHEVLVDTTDPANAEGYEADR